LKTEVEELSDVISKSRNGGGSGRNEEWESGRWREGEMGYQRKRINCNI